MLLTKKSSLKWLIYKNYFMKKLVQGQILKILDVLLRFLMAAGVGWFWQKEGKKIEITDEWKYEELLKLINGEKK